MEDNIIENPNLAAPRTPIMDRFNQFVKGAIKITVGAHAEEWNVTGKEPTYEGDMYGSSPDINKQLCIMEATGYILGYKHFDDSPPCTSAVIRNLLIKFNDEEDSDRRRKKLIEIIPAIVNTAPTVWIARGRKGKKQWVLRTDSSLDEYKKAEQTRQDMIKAITRPTPVHRYETFDATDTLMTWPMHKVNAFIRDLAAVAKFAGSQNPTGDPNDWLPS